MVKNTNKGILVQKMNRMAKNGEKPMLTIAEWAVFNGLSLATQYKYARLAGYSLEKGRSANLFTKDQNQDMLSFAPTKGRPRIYEKV
jgi:hypothetical protein